MHGECLNVPLTHRIQLMLDESQFQSLERRARKEGRTIGALVRDAIDRTWVAPETARRSAADVILGAETMPVPDVQELRDELDEARAGRFR